MSILVNLLCENNFGYLLAFLLGSQSVVIGRSNEPSSYVGEVLDGQDVSTESIPNTGCDQHMNT
jgi:hypothetical protein